MLLLLLLLKMRLTTWLTSLVAPLVVLLFVVMGSCMIPVLIGTLMTKKWVTSCPHNCPVPFLFNLSNGSSVEQVGFGALTAKTQVTAAPLAAPTIAPAGA